MPYLTAMVKIKDYFLANKGGGAHFLDEKRSIPEENLEFKTLILTNFTNLSS
jgi:hypothetical protein